MPPHLRSELLSLFGAVLKPICHDASSYVSFPFLRCLKERFKNIPTTVYLAWHHLSFPCCLFITYLLPGPAIVCQGSTHPRQVCVSQTRCLLEDRTNMSLSLN